MPYDRQGESTTFMLNKVINYFSDKFNFASGSLDLSISFPIRKCSNKTMTNRGILKKNIAALILIASINI